MLEPELGKDEGDRAITSLIRELVFPQTSPEWLLTGQPVK